MLFPKRPYFLSKEILVEIADNLRRLMMILSFYSLKVIIFFDLLPAFFKKVEIWTHSLSEP
jgi:hypothetical protein